MINGDLAVSSRVRAAGGISDVRMEEYGGNIVAVKTVRVYELGVDKARKVCDTDTLLIGGV
jgi:hypothetical protein